MDKLGPKPPSLLTFFSNYFNAASEPDRRGSPGEFLGPPPSPSLRLFGVSEWEYPITLVDLIFILSLSGIASSLIKLIPFDNGYLIGSPPPLPTPGPIIVMASHEGVPIHPGDPASSSFSILMYLSELRLGFKVGILWLVENADGIKLFF